MTGVEELAGDFGFRPPQSPVEEGKEYECKIEDLGREGDGLARINNFVVFVPNTVVGQRVKIRIVRVMRRVAFGEVIEELSSEEAAPAETPAEAPAEETTEAPAEEAPPEEPPEEPAEEQPPEEPPEEPAEEPPEAPPEGE